MAGTRSDGEGDDGARSRGAEVDGAVAREILRAADAGRDKLTADAALIDALVRLDEFDVAARAIEEQRADLVEYAIDLREAVADAVERRDPSQSEDGTE